MVRDLDLATDIEILQSTESFFEAFPEIVKTLICDLEAPFCKSTNSSYKNQVQFKVEIDGL